MAGSMATKVKKSSEKDLYVPKQTLLHTPKNYESYSGACQKVEFAKAGNAIAKKRGIAIPKVDSMEIAEEVNLKVSKGKKYLIATNVEMGIFTEGKNWNSLMKNIREVIEAYFNIPSADIVKINLQIDPMVTTDA
jgi:hypothetical protein